MEMNFIYSIDIPKITVTTCTCMYHPVYQNHKRHLSTESYGEEEEGKDEYMSSKRGRKGRQKEEARKKKGYK